MSHVLSEKFSHSAKPILPIIVIVLALNFTIVPMPFAVRGMFLLGSLLLVVGTTLFTLGADLAMMPIGEHLGNYLSGSRKIGLIIFSVLLMGIMVTIAEPDLQVLSLQVPNIPKSDLIITVAVGLGVFLVIAIMRILFDVSLAKIFAVSVIGALILGIFVQRENFAVSFDAGGVTTGPFAIPFILALGVGFSSVRSGQGHRDDSFGLAGICSIGPIYGVMILSFFHKSGGAGLETADISQIHTISDLFSEFFGALPHYFYEIFLAIAPLLVLFLIFQFAALKLPASTLARICFGLVYTYLGLVIFITGVSVGFLPAGMYIGQELGGLDFNWVLVPLGAVIGFFIVLAEPAVHVLVEEVESLTGGALPKSVLRRTLSVSIAVAVALAMIRILTGVSVWWFIAPGYLLTVILSRFSPKLFMAVALDSGAVATGPMATTFLMPFTLGACEAAGGNVMMDAFGVVALVAMTPLFTVQIVGLIYNRKAELAGREESEAIETLTHDLEEHEIMERWGQAEYSDEQSRFDADVDMDYVASPEWGEEVIGYQRMRAIALDNNYIRFDVGDGEEAKGDEEHGKEGEA